MAIDDCLQGIEKSIKALTGIESEHTLQQIIISLSLQQMLEQDAFLQRCQRIDILDIAYPAGDCIGNGVDFVLGQRNQRQHFRCYLSAVRRDEIGRHNKITGVILRGQNGLRQFVKNRCGKYTADVKPPAEIVQLFYQADDHQ